MVGSFFLSDKSVSLLRIFSESPAFSEGELSPYSESCLAQLLEAGLIESQISEMDFAHSRDYVIPIYYKYAITEKGKSYIEEFDRQIIEKRNERIRYILTTVIATLALITAIVSICLQYLPQLRQLILPTG